MDEIDNLEMCELLFLLFKREFEISHLKNEICWSKENVFTFTCENGK